jgi:hypothetical protein
MDINAPLSGVPSALLPFKVLSPIMMEAVNDTPFASLVGTDPHTSPFVLRFKNAGEGFVDRWGATRDMNPENIAVDLEAYSTAIESKKYAQESVNISKFKWENLERFPDLQKVGTPIEAAIPLLLQLARRKYAQRFILEVIRAMTSGTKGVDGRYDYTANGQGPIVGRAFYGTTDLGVVTPYVAVGGGATFPATVHGVLNAITANLSVKALRGLYNAAIKRTPQPALYPASYLKEGKFSEQRKYYLFATPESIEWMQNNDEDFKKQQLERGIDLARQANPMQGDRIAAVTSGITVISTPELTEYAAFDENGLNPAGPYHHNLLVGCDAVRITQSTTESGLKIMMNQGSFQAEEDEAVKVLYSYMKGYKCPAYFNKAAGTYAGDPGVNKWTLAESGVIHFITKVA